MDWGRRTAQRKSISVKRGCAVGGKIFRSRLWGRMGPQCEREKQASRGLPTDYKLKEVRGTAYELN